MLLDKELWILEEFTADYSKKIYGRGVAKKLKMNQKTVANILNKLEKEDILKFIQEGRNKYYYLNRFNPHIKEIAKLTEIKKKIEFLDKNKKLKDLFKKVEEKSEGITIVFGSYAKGTNTEKSDIDLFVIGKASEVSDLEKLYRVKINVIESAKEKFDKDETIIKEVIKNHIILKGVEEFIDLTW